jgi:hypothetical protein
VTKASHAGGVDDVTLISRVFFGSVEHHGREYAHAVGHAHQVDADHPLPVGRCVFPDQASRSNACVIENEVRCTKAFQDGGAQCLHLGSFGDIYPHGQYLGACGLHLGGSPVQRILLHINQYQVHAQLGGNAGALQTKP